MTSGRNRSVVLTRKSPVTRSTGSPSRLQSPGGGPVGGGVLPESAVPRPSWKPRGTLPLWVARPVDESHRPHPATAAIISFGISPARIVEEELALLREVSARLEGTVPAPPSAAAIVEELEHVRTALGEETRADDRAALLQQWDRHSALLRHLRGASRPEAVDAGSPYFAHMRLAEDGGEQDVLLGKTTRLLPGLP